MPNDMPRAPDLPAFVTDSARSHPVAQAGGASPRDHYAPLVEAAAGGDRAALETLLMRAQEVAYRFGLLVCGHTDDAEDVMQEALLETYRHVSSIRQPEAFRGWLYRTVRNACLMQRRTRVDEPKRLLSIDEHREGTEWTDPPAPEPGPEDTLLNVRLRERLLHAMRSLPRTYRAVVFLREMEGLSTREVAHVVGTSEANVKQRLHRARVLLRAQLEER
jgi:RNA polymerase sigma factor (sigma-70 family)